MSYIRWTFCFEISWIVIYISAVENSSEHRPPKYTAKLVQSDRMHITKKCLSYLLWCIYLMQVVHITDKRFDLNTSNSFPVFIVSPAETQSLTNTVHKTQAAAERPSDMWCYTCHSMEYGDQCVENITANFSSFLKKCKDDEFTCMVQKFSYTTSTENATSSPKMWSLERKCVANCEAGCIVIGERTKLYACTSCCTKPYCNIDKGGAAKLSTNPKNAVETLLITIFVLTVVKLLSSSH